MSDEALYKDISGKIEREKRLIDGYTRVRQSSNNPQVQSSTDVQIRDARRNIQYFESKLNELQMRRGMGGMSLGSASNGKPQQPGREQPQPQPGYQPYGPESVGSRRDYGAGGYSDPQNSETGPRRAPYDPPAPGSPSPKQGQRYTRLDLIKDDSPHLGPRIQLMLSQLQFKLNVEKQYKDGIDKIVRSYSMDGDRKIGQEASGKRVESMQKIQLLSQALKRYEDLNVGMEDGDAADDDSVTAPALRKALTGVLSMKIHAISDVNHATAGRFSRGPESFVIVKVEDETKSRTKATRTDKWTDESLDIDINKGNEVELTVYDKAGGDHPRPVGLLWIRISDVAEEMRRKKIEHDFNQAGWVSADKMDSSGLGRQNMQFQPPPGQMSNQSLGNAMSPAYGATGHTPAQTAAAPIDAWFSLEPVGRIHLTLNFAKETRKRMPYDVNGIRRKGAVRQRKEEVHELYGHKFVAQTFYNVMRCAFCGGLLKYDTGMQCSDCKYMCHEKCYSKVVTKCISRPNAESDPEEAKVNHRIPHRFEAYGNISANWCCHCGYLLPLGRKQPRRCRECKATAHAQCTHLVPDLCGMTMDQITQILGAIKDVRSRPAAPRDVRTLRAQAPRPRPPLSGTQSSMSLSSESTLTDQPPRERLSYKEGETIEQATYRPNLGTAPVSLPPQPPPKAQEIHKRPVPPRTDSSFTAAQAAAKALQAKNQTSPTESRPPYTRGGSSGYPTSTGRSSQAPPASQHAPYDPGKYASYDHRPGPTQQPVQPPYQQPLQMPQAPVIEPPRPQASYQPPQVQQPSTQQASSSTVAASKDQAAPALAKGRGPRVGLDHFNFLAVLGKGNFGKVMLAETKASKQLYAIKVLKKEFIIENDEVESTKSERDVFIIANKARHPFLLSLHACFQTETRVYFVMEYISGGDLMLHIQRGQFGLKRAQFYAAEVCLALKYFHENGVVYRDLKLDNILLTLDGHIKIADYGLCKKDMYYGSTTSTFCGTPEFMAPEILLDKKYGRAVDWWAFGVLIYQMLLQQSPFRGEDEDEIYDAILADEPLYPIHMPRDSVSILQKLLTREPEMRLGSGPTDAQEIMSHAFFRNVNWDDIQEKRVPAPFLPQIRNATDTSNFDSEFTSVTPVLTPVQSVLSQAMQEEFRGFSYSADFV